jgi:uncharacterized protein YbjT (DUF2867 family)
MKLVVIGGSGLIGSRTVSALGLLGHEVVSASLQSGVDLLTGKGLDDALEGADVVIDVANSPSFEDRPAMDFFQTAGTNILEAERKAGVKHHVALSVVGTEGLQASGYFRAKLAQEQLIRNSGRPWTILRSTQFFPFVGGIIEAGAIDGQVHLAPVLVQPIAADDVVEYLVDIATGAPRNAILEVAGPAPLKLTAMAEQYLSAKEDPRHVLADADALYFGTRLDDDALRPGPEAHLGSITYAEWLQSTIPAA